MAATADELKSELAAICKLAWQSGLLRGFSGNASARLPDDQTLITVSGLAKGRLGGDDFVIVNKNGETVSGSQKPSLELRLHLALYEAVPACNSILHTHPIILQALTTVLAKNGLGKTLLNLDIAEADYWRERLAIAPEYPPGSPELAPAAVKALRLGFSDDISHLLPCAIWLSGHGLCALGESPASALGISEQLERIAHLQWAILALQRD